MCFSPSFWTFADNNLWRIIITESAITKKAIVSSAAITGKRRRRRRSKNCFFFLENLNEQKCRLSKLWAVTKRCKSLTKPIPAALQYKAEEQLEKEQRSTQTTTRSFRLLRKKKEKEEDIFAYTQHTHTIHTFSWRLLHNNQSTN